MGFPLAPEVLCHVFSFLSHADVYYLRAVCRLWKELAEKHIYLSIKSNREFINVKIGPTSSLELIPHRFDSENGVIEFRPKDGMTISPATWNAHHRRMQVHFSQWTQKPMNGIDALSPKELAQVLFHVQYNAALERMFELPPWTAGSQCDHRYVGDQGLILSLSYLSSASSRLSTSYFAYQAMQPNIPRIQIHYVRVTLTWILSGFQAAITPSQIYASRYARLTQSLAQHGCYKYDPLAEPILSHIVEADHADPPSTLLTFVQEHSHECHTRLSRLQHMLEGAGVDARVLWKYTFAKSFVIGNGSLLGEEDVVRRIQDSEEEWCLQRQSLARRLKVS